MFTIIGSGFGLYGYLPALVEGLGESVALPRACEAAVRARPELEVTLRGIRWVDDGEAALAAADSVVIATPPRRQFEVASRCIALPGVRRLVLEKPLADTPARAAELLSTALSAGKRLRVGYTLLQASWHESLAWPVAGEAGDAVSVAWTFMAHHFSHGVDTWKRRHAEGGGVLRFFGIHLVALLADRGYATVRRSTLEGELPGEPERWTAVFAGARLPDCHVAMDSRCAATRFEIAHRTATGQRTVLSMGDPFEAERPRAGGDRRVGTLERLLRTFDLDDRPFHDLYARANALWQRVEAP